jgi:hypothetical protein
MGHRLGRWVGLGVALALVLGAAEALAAPARSRLRAGLEGLRWGASVEDVQAALRQRIAKRYQRLMHEAEDPIARRELARRMEREIDALIVGYTKFDGQRTGLEVGIAGDEFRHGTGESVLRVREPGRDRYYFFIGGKLWKNFSAFARDAVKDLPFVPFLAKMRRRYGRPTKIHRAKREGKRVIVSAEWRERGVHLEVRDRSELFQSYTAAFSDPRVRARIEDLRGKPTRKKVDATDALIELVTSGSAGEPAAPPPPKPAVDGGAPADGEGNGEPAADPLPQKKRRVVDIE